MNPSQKQKIALAAFWLTLIGCTEKTLKPLEKLYMVLWGVASADVQFCLTPPTEYRQVLKTIVIMDKSSSNQSIPNPTDPFGFRRYMPLVNYLNGVADDPGYAYYGLVNFSDSGQIVQGFTDDRTQFINTIQSQWNEDGFQQPRDLGFTDYLGALNAAQTLIEQDIDAQKNDLSQTVPIKSVYNIIFITDGYPIVADTSSATGMSNQVYNPDIRNEIDDILSLQVDPNFGEYIDEIILNTGYYYINQDTNASQLLAQMAAQASGRAYTFGAGVNINFNMFALPVRRVTQNLRDVFVENASIIWWDNGAYMRDSDQDGLPDDIELGFGSNAGLKDSDGNGVSDFVEYRINGKPCKSPTCSNRVAERENFSACSGLMPPTQPNGGPNPAPDGVNSAPFGRNYFGDRRSSGMNDCEKFIMNGNVDEFSSNRTGIPDFLALKNRIPFALPYNPYSTDAAADGSSSYNDIKQGAPTFLSRASVMGFVPIETTLNLESDQNGLKCYRLYADKITIAGQDNLIRIYVTENSSMVENNPRVKVAEKRLEGRDLTVKFLPEDFK